MLVYGADPVGLLLALELRRRGVARVRVARPVDASTPLPVPLLLDAATTAALVELGLAGVLRDAGTVPLARVLVARVPREPGRGGRAAPGEAAFAPHAGPGPLVVERAGLCEALQARLAALGVAVEPMTDLGAVVQGAEGVSALLVHHLGDTREILRARWLVWTFYAPHPLNALTGLVYAPASVRDGIEQSGLVRLPAPQSAGTAHLWTDGRGYAAVLPLVGRLAHVELSLPDVGPDGAEARAWSTLRAALGWAAGVRWAGRRPDLDASYPGGVGPLPRLREGRVLLAGAAAHGAAWGAAGPAAVNAELGDVLTLAPRLAAALAGKASGGALDSWANERRVAVLQTPRLLGADRARALAEGRLEDAGALVLGHRAMPARDTDEAGPRWHLVPPNAGGGGTP